MPISVSCSCGASYMVPDHRAGKQGRCGRCKSPIQVPNLPAEAEELPVPTPAVEPAPDPGSFVDLDLDPLPSPAPPEHLRATNPPPTPTASNAGRHRRTKILAALGLAFIREQVRTGELRSMLQACKSAEGMTVAVSPASPVSQDIIFDVRNVDGGTRKVDVLHLLLQFGWKVEGYPYEALHLRARGD